MSNSIDTSITTLGALRASGYQSRTVKEELRANLVDCLQNDRSRFEGIHGFDNTVLPDLERAILSRHNILLLGLRGQAKTRIARQMLGLLDEYIPVISDMELHEDPFNPLTREARDLIAEKGEETPIHWIHRDERYTEKLATPDVSVADLIGDVDPIKAANLRLPYSDERVIHFGLVPRAHRGLFVINELPDLQPRIQVALFNILQEGDIQIRGFKLRLPLDIQFVFTANPEDYTNRGSIVTPLKDRIESQILTHYPKDLSISRRITDQETRSHEDQHARVRVHDIARDLIERIAIEARSSEYVDEKSGVSARMTISARENLLASAERRTLINGEESTHVRIGDFWGVIPALTGKVELVYEGEQEGPFLVALNLLGKAIRSEFAARFPSPTQESSRAEPDGQGSPYDNVVAWFGEGNSVDLLHDCSEKEYRSLLDAVPGLDEAISKLVPGAKDEERYFLKEFVLHGLAEYSLLSKDLVQTGAKFGDLLSSMLSNETVDDDLF